MKHIFLCFLNFRHNELRLARRIGIKIQQNRGCSAHRLAQHKKFVPNGTHPNVFGTSQTRRTLSETAG